MRKGSKLSEDQKARVAAGQRKAWERRLAEGYVVGQETREKMSVSQTLKWVRLKTAKDALSIIDGAVLTK